MALTVWQCCCTHPNGETVWFPREGVPPEIKKQCDRFFASAASRVRETHGRGNSVYELRCDGQALCLTCTRREDPAISGQSVGFSHSILFPLNRNRDTSLFRNTEFEDLEENVLYNPNIFLSLSEDVFLPSSSMAWHGDYTSLKRDPPLTMTTAMKKAGIPDRETYKALLQCVYVRMHSVKYDHAPEEPLYVQYDGTWEQMCALLYCIWSGLPFFLRQSLSVSSEPREQTALDTGYSIVFATPSYLASMENRNSQYSINPATGQTGGKKFAPGKCQRFNYYRYVGIGVDNLPDLDALSRYYRAITLSAEKSGNADSEKMLMVYGMKYLNEHLYPPETRIGKYDDRELLDWVTEAVQLDCLNTETEKYRSEMVRTLQRRNLVTRLKPSAREALKNLLEKEQAERERLERKRLEQERKKREERERKAQELREQEQRNREQEEKRKSEERQKKDVLESKVRQEQEQPEPRLWYPMVPLTSSQPLKEKQDKAQFVHAMQREESAIRYHIFRPDGTVTDEEAVMQDIEEKKPEDQMNIEEVEKAINNYLKRGKLTYEILRTLWENYPHRKLWGYRSFNRVFISAGWKLYINKIRGRSNPEDSDAFEDYKALAELVWSNPDDAISDAKLAYWDLDGCPVSAYMTQDPLTPILGDRAEQLNFSRFSFEKSDFYREIAIYHPNSLRFIGFLNMALKCGWNLDNGTWLADVARFFNDNPAITFDSRRNAIGLLAEYLRKASGYRFSVSWYRQWIFLATFQDLYAPDRNKKIWDIISGLYNAAIYREGEDLLNYYDQFIKLTTSLREKDKLHRLVVGLLEAVCKEYETGDSYTPLDFWLVLGTAMGLTPSCFNVFDPPGAGLPGGPGFEALLFQKRPIDVVAESKLLKNNQNIRYAALNYGLKGYSKYKKTVRKWLHLAM